MDVNQEFIDTADPEAGVEDELTNAEVLVAWVANPVVGAVDVIILCEKKIN